jgi:hypothetical protein
MTAESGDQYRIDGTDGCPSIVVPACPAVPSMPYYDAYLRWTFHRDGCSQCGTAVLPCFEGAVLQGRLAAVLQWQHAASHQN